MFHKEAPSWKSKWRLVLLGEKFCVISHWGCLLLLLPLGPLSCFSPFFPTENIVLLEIEWQISQTHLLVFCESAYWDTFGGFLKNYLFLRSLFPLPLPLNVIGDPYRPYFAMCACAKAESWEEIEAMRNRGAAERPNTAACELSENGEFRRWIYLIFF